MPEENQNQKILLIGGVVVFLLIAGIVTFSLLSKGKMTAPQTTPVGIDTQETAPKVPPTLSPERIEIIKQMETHVVSIEGNAFVPGSLTVKLHDQVQWKNNDTVTHKVKGDDWGNVPIQPGQSFTQAFKTSGVFPYIDALNPEMVGTVTVQ